MTIRGQMASYIQRKYLANPESNEPTIAGQKVENGFYSQSDSSMSFDDGTRTFSIEPTGEYLPYTSNNRYYKVYDEQTIVISDVEGLHWIYFNGDDLDETTSFVPAIITAYAFVAIVYWDADNSESIMFGEERHGNVMGSLEHLYNHVTFGARYQEGFALGDFSIDGSGNDDADVQFSVEDGIFWDEDIEHTVADDDPQPLAAPAEIPVFYRSGASGKWRMIDATVYPLTTIGSGRLAWNEFTGGAWQLTEVAHNNFVNYHYFTTNDLNHPIVAIVGQEEYTTVSDAREGATDELIALDFGLMDTLTPEFIAIGSVIFQTNDTYSNAVKARARATDLGDNYVDWRFL